MLKVKLSQLLCRWWQLV